MKSYCILLTFIFIIVGCDHNSTNIQKPICKALLATDFNSMYELKSVVNLNYVNQSNDSCKGTVQISYTNKGQTIYTEFSDGVSEGDIVKAHKGSILDKILLALKAPYAVKIRNELSKIFMLSRRRPTIFGENDVAFYDLAQASMRNVTVTKNSFKTLRDSLEKGYINTFNHITAQALITAIYNEDIAHFIASVHERFHMPHLVSGKFSIIDLTDTVNYPVDNYIDIINNEIGQELGKYLKHKYNINQKTKWTADFTCKFLNEIQDYYAESFDIQIKSYKNNDRLIMRFSKKIEAINHMKSYLHIK
ncbi:MAG: hypothetical protein P8I11_04955 [Bacteroidia bacterium]|jgi:hypothetical protein|nr:hypothetical protein [Bacteroidia bacterium]